MARAAQRGGAAAPPHVEPRGPPEELRAHRAARAREAALERLSASMAAARSGGSPFLEEDEHAELMMSDVDEMDAWMKASLRGHEEDLQRDVSEALLQRMVGEIAAEIESIDAKR